MNLSPAQSRIVISEISATLIVEHQRYAESELPMLQGGKKDASTILGNN
jgi:hypothetical protein